MTALLITCANCNRDYEPSRHDILAGIKHWRLCPNCRAEDAAELPTQEEDSDVA